MYPLALGTNSGYLKIMIWPTNTIANKNWDHQVCTMEAEMK